MKMWKVYDDDDANDDGRQRTNCDLKNSRVFGSGELKSDMDSDMPLQVIITFQNPSDWNLISKTAINIY